MKKVTVLFLLLGLTVVGSFVIPKVEQKRYLTPFNIQCRCTRGCYEDYTCIFGGCIEGWSGPTCQRENTVMQLSKIKGARTLKGNTDPPSVARGNLISWNGECIQMDTGLPNPKWEIELNETKNIYWIDVHIQTKEGVLPMMSTINVTVDDILCYNGATNLTSLTNINITCTQPVLGHKILIEIGQPIHNKQLKLALCDLRFYNCSKGWYSEQCDKRCNCFYSGDQCDTVTGKCQYGCNYGFKEPECLIPCDSGQWGHNCSYTCGHCTNTECNRQTGECDEQGCQKGWSGTDCQYCDVYMFGPECNLRCGHCVDGICDADTGNCFRGCMPGFHGNDCTQECLPYTHGPNCGNICGNCSLGEPCDTVTGVCLNGCTDGFTAPLCVDSDDSWSETKIIILFLCLSISVILSVFFIVLVYTRRRSTKSKTGLENTGYEPSLPDLDRYDSSNDVHLSYPGDTQIDISKLKAYIDRRMAHDGFNREYRRLPTGLNGKHIHASMATNKSKNRFLSIYPYDHARVKFTVKGDDKSDYINASYIDGYEKRRLYVATQGPIPSTIADFWKMVWQEGTGKIVMLANVLENSRIKCSQYWPSHVKEKMTIKNLEITLQHITERSDYVIRTFQVKDIESKECRRILQFHYTTWSDHGVPSAPSIIAFWKVVKSTTTDLTGPMVVHCSAGIGRTGTFLGLDCLMDEAKNSAKVDIFKYVSIMRANRVNMIQTREQYIFLHYVVHEAILSQDTMLTFKELERKPRNEPLVSESVMKDEFKNISLLKKPISTMKSRSALLPDNVFKNRSTSKIPHDDYRVFLVTSVKDRNDYIMANLVPSIYRRDGLIATQLPLESTVVDMWRMVYEYNSLTIVSLVQTRSPTDEVSVAYWPAPESKMEVGPFIIRNTGNLSKNSFYNHSVLELEKTDSPAPNLKSTVHMFSVNDWPSDSLLPDKTQLLNLVGAIQSRQKEEGRHTIIVQDLDGTSKCNMFCAIVNCLNKLKEDGILDVFLTVRYIQTIQPNCFNTPKEYMFCYEVIKNYIDSLSSSVLKS